jgi:hypothetical protein
MAKVVSAPAAAAVFCAVAGAALALGCAQKSHDETANPEAASTAGTVASSWRTEESPQPNIEVPPSLERTCRQICTRSQQLSCQKSEQCLPNCLAMGSQTPCTDQMLAFFRCLVAQPLANWECAPDGVAAIRDGFCMEEQGKTVACVQAKMQ